MLPLRVCAHSIAMLHMSRCSQHAASNAAVGHLLTGPQTHSLCPGMQLNPHVKELSLYDIAGTPGVACDIGHCNTKAISKVCCVLCASHAHVPLYSSHCHLAVSMLCLTYTSCPQSAFKKPQNHVLRSLPWSRRAPWASKSPVGLPRRVTLALQPCASCRCMMHVGLCW